MNMHTKKISGGLLMALMASGAVSAANPVVLEAPQESQVQRKVLTPAEYQRREDQTLLTIPEWFLVHSPHEYAEYLKTERPSRFPFMGHIRQFWDTYAAVYRETKDRYSFNSGYHVMVMTIGISTTVEYAVKGLYEAVFGALTELDDYRTAEDRYAAKVAREYVDFIVVDPWYKFDFMRALKGLWQDVPRDGKHQLRKWERRYALSTEYLVKAGYAWVIQKATQASFEPPKPVTAVVASFPSHASTQQVRGMKVIKRLDGRRYLVTLPRYQAFSNSAVALARVGARFEEIAGNQEFIMLSVLTRDDFKASNLGANVVLTQPILTVPGRQRIVYRVPIAQLSEVLNKARRQSIKIEHIYDF